MRNIKYHTAREAFFRYIEKHIDGRTNLIRKSKWRRSAESKKPQMPDPMVDGLVDLALSRPDQYERALKNAIQHYRFYTIRPDGDRLVAHVDPKLRLINDLLLDPQNDAILAKLIHLHTNK